MIKAVKPNIGLWLWSETLPESLYVCAEVLDILKIAKNCTDLRCFIFQFSEACSFVWGAKPTKGLNTPQTKLQASLNWNILFGGAKPSRGDGPEYR